MLQIYNRNKILVRTELQANLTKWKCNWSIIREYYKTWHFGSLLNWSSVKVQQKNELQSEMIL